MPRRKPKVTVGDLSELLPDDNNANGGTERGAYMLRQSVEQAGVGRGIVIDRNGKIIAGNKSHATIGEVGLSDLIIVETDGNTLVATKRTDLDLNAEPGTPEHDKARVLAIADNKAGADNLSWVPSALLDYGNAGIQVDDWFRSSELDEIFKGSPESWGTPGENDEGGGEGEGGSEAGGDSSTQGSPKPGTKIPLAITLGSADVKRWSALKERYGTASDTATLLRLLDALEAEA